MFAVFSLSRAAVRQGFRIRPKTTPCTARYNKYLLHTTPGIHLSAKSSDPKMRVAIIGQSLFGKEVGKANTRRTGIGKKLCKP